MIQKIPLSVSFHVPFAQINISFGDAAPAQPNMEVEE